ncbi:glcNac transferase [Pandoravirus inopinatum]|uniref:GlcNac transferase n=1 Tax=Pandoravirus inopinatum TaxID=1605721 RepID=A0A0B5JEK5_9VIRU|nr:glcNac transferase [Pandoravirus inopinatum]AJF98197.1 glcNac transferase [Pandoravirus inopinatum]
MLLVRRHLYRGQRYYATVSVHCRPCHGWDVAALADLDRAALHRAAAVPTGPTSRKVIITMRPDDEDDQLDDPDDEEEDDANDDDNNTDYGVATDTRANNVLGGSDLLQSAHGSGEASKPAAARRGLFMHRLRANGQQRRRQAHATAGTPKPRRPPTFGVFETWSPRGLPVVRTRAFRHAPVRPFGTPFWHSAFSLCEASPLVGMDPWDPWYEHLTMDGAVDWCTTVRLWTHGWDFYSPTRALVRRTLARRDFDAAPESPADIAPATRREREGPMCARGRCSAWRRRGMHASNPMALGRHAPPPSTPVCRALTGSTGVPTRTPLSACGRRVAPRRPNRRALTSARSLPSMVRGRAFSTRPTIAAGLPCSGDACPSSSSSSSSPRPSLLLPLLPSLLLPLLQLFPLIAFPPLCR